MKDYSVLLPQSLAFLGIMIFLVLHSVFTPFPHSEMEFREKGKKRSEGKGTKKRKRKRRERGREGSKI